MFASLVSVSAKAAGANEGASTSVHNLNIHRFAPRSVRASSCTSCPSRSREHGPRQRRCPCARQGRDARCPRCRARGACRSSPRDRGRCRQYCGAPAAERSARTSTTGSMVRELEQVVRAAAALSDGCCEIGLEHLPPQVLRSSRTSCFARRAPAGASWKSERSRSGGRCTERHCRASRVR